jgi:hypothetical protein
MLSNCAHFQALCQAANAAAALASIYAHGKDADPARPFAVVALEDPRYGAVSGSTADRFKPSGSVFLSLEVPSVKTGTITGQTSAAIFDCSALAGFEDDHFNGLRLTMTSGAASGEYQTIMDYTGSNGRFILQRSLTVLPGVGSTFKISPLNAADSIKHFLNVLGDIVDDLTALSGTGGCESFEQLSLEEFGRPALDKEADNDLGARLRLQLK